MKKFLAIFAAAAISIGFGANPASAAVVTKIVDFTATDFVKTFPFGSPIATPPASLVGSFTITFDPMIDYSDETNGIKLDDLNIPFASPLGFSYYSSAHVIGVGGTINEINRIVSDESDFLLVIEDFGDWAVPPSGALAGFCLKDGYCYNSRNISVSVSDATAAVPEAATWAMVLLGVGAIGAAMRRKHCRTMRYNFV